MTRQLFPANFLDAYVIKLDGEDQTQLVTIHLDLHCSALFYIVMLWLGGTMRQSGPLKSMVLFKINTLEK